uniref:Uncharacterized protein n=1 Tax=Oryza barthii TaxID=65489 RepID=A0A0D3FTU8_9ORYZ
MTSGTKTIKRRRKTQRPHAMWGLLRRSSSSGFSPSSTAEEVTAGIDGSGLVALITGVCFVPFKLSEDGIELHFATNHVGHFLLTDLLIEKMKVTAIESGKEGRVVMVASVSYSFSYRGGIRFDKTNDESGFLAYGQSKLANILHSNLLSSHLKEQDAKVIVNSLHPGAVATNILHHWCPLYGAIRAIGKYFVKGVEQGAATVCYVALHPQVAGVTGEYFSDCNITELKSHALDMDLAKRLWDFSLSLIR